MKNTKSKINLRGQEEAEAEEAREVVGVAEVAMETSRASTRSDPRPLGTPKANQTSSHQVSKKLSSLRPVKKKKRRKLINQRSSQRKKRKKILTSRWPKKTINQPRKASHRPSSKIS